MIDLLVFVRWLHVIGAAVLLGTGCGIAFFMLLAHRSRDPAAIAHVASSVVVADFLFTASAVVVQPVTGIWLAWLIGWPLSTPWILISTGLYLMVGCFWLPVVWLQIRMRDLARCALARSQPLPQEYFRYFRIWFASGIPAFAAVLAIIWLMLAKPSF